MDWRWIIVVSVVATIAVLAAAIGAALWVFREREPDFVLVGDEYMLRPMPARPRRRRRRWRITIEQIEVDPETGADLSTPPRRARPEPPERRPLYNEGQ